MSNLLIGLELTPNDKLTLDDKKKIAENIGCLVSMIKSINEEIEDGESGARNLAYAGAFIVEVVENLNIALQYPPKAN